MDATLQQLNFKSIDKSTWESFRFEKIANRVAESVDPKTTDLEIYVGLEHIDAEDIHIKRFGTPAEVSGGKLKCYPGDVIFGKRRAYQRKAAVVDFEGICSAHSFVFRANPEVIHPKLFPFFLHSDQFMHRAVDISVGGLSPTINWGDLKGQEFLLPPKEEQAKLAELLWAMDEVIEKEKGIRNKLQITEKSFRSIEIDNLITEEVKIDDLIFPMSMIKVGKIDNSKYVETGKYPIVDQSMEFIIGYTDDESLVYKDKLPVLVFGDHTTIIKYIDFPFVMGADGTKVVKPKADLDVFYLYHAIKKLNIQPQGYRRHFSILKNSFIKVPTQGPWLNKFRERLTLIDNSLNEIGRKINNSQSLQKSIINQLF
nr:restriction endonuclease subunit S [uncultured Fluviicola sp.]